MVNRLEIIRDRGTGFDGQSSACTAKGDLNTLVFHVAKCGNLNAIDEDGLALIHYAACRGDLSLVRKL